MHKLSDTLSLPSQEQPSGQSCRVGPIHPFAPFPKDEMEQSIPDRFEQQVAKYPDRPAVIMRNSAGRAT